MEFEYDPAKSEKNKEKHAIDFEEAQALWFDPDSVGFVAKSDDEDRFAIIATLKKKAMGRVLHPKREQNTNHFSQKSSNQRKKTL